MAFATLCDKRHDNVMADIRKMLNELGLYAPDFSGTYTTEQGNQYECFNLPKRDIIAPKLHRGYSYVWTKNTTYCGLSTTHSFAH